MRTRTDLWTYGHGLDTKSPWTGYTVHATDGDIGKIDEMSTETGRGSVVVDTGFWIFGKKRMLPASSVVSVNHKDETVTVNLTKEQIKNAPDYDALRRMDDNYYDETTNYYGPLL